MGLGTHRALLFVICILATMLAYQNCGFDDSSPRYNKGTKEGGSSLDPVVQIVTAPADLGQDAVFNLSLEKPQAEALHFTFATQDDSALAGQHYIAVAGQGSIPAGQLTTTFTVKTKYTPLLDYNSKQYKVNLAFASYPGLTIQALGLFKNISSVHYSSNTGGASTGQLHTCNIKSDGALYCWGSNASGQLGVGDTTTRTSPTLVSGFTTGTQVVAAGAQHTCAVRNGAVFCWGRNTSGALGNNSTTNSTVPVAVSGLDSGVTALSLSGDDTSCAIKSGALYCWGKNDFAQIGHNLTTTVLVPYRVKGFDMGVTAVASGAGHTCVIKNGALFCWGRNNFGQLGLGTTTTDTTRNPENQTLAPIVGFDTGVAVIASTTHSVCALKVGGVLFCWGYNGTSLIGTGGTANVLTPAPLAAFASDTTHVSIAWDHTCALKAGNVYCWGNNSDGELGYNDQTTRPTPPTASLSLPLAAGEGLVSLHTGGMNIGNNTQSHTCGRTNVGRIWCWGANTTGALGDATTVRKLVPILVPSF